MQLCLAVITFYNLEKWTTDTLKYLKTGDSCPFLVLCDDQVALLLKRNIPNYLNSLSPRDSEVGKVKKKEKIKKRKWGTKRRYNKGKKTE